MTPALVWRPARREAAGALLARVARRRAAAPADRPRAGGMMSGGRGKAGRRAWIESARGLRCLCWVPVAAKAHGGYGRRAGGQREQGDRKSVV